ncbi:MAG: thioesterase family protein [Nocardioidaceae bacterium]
MTVLPDQPVFARPAARRFVPGPLAAGPFAGLQGGGVAGVMATSMEEAAPKGMEALSIRADFLRPAAPEPIDVDVELVRTGSRVAFLAATASIDAKPIARAVMAFGRPIESSLVSERPTEVRVPDDATPLLPRVRRARPTLMDAFDARTADGTFWFRWLVPLCEGSTPFAHALAPADWSHGLTRPPSEGPMACPNVDLSVAVHRPCAGEWTGLRVDSTWTATGSGTAGGLLVDELGAFGRVAIAFVVVP